MADQLDHPPVHVSIEFLAEETPLFLYIWAHICAARIIDQLDQHGVPGALSDIRINGQPGVPP